MFRLLYSLRNFSLVAVVCSLLGSVLMFWMGAVKTFKAFAIYFRFLETDEAFQSVGTVNLTTKFLVQSIDLFLTGLVLLVLAFGIYTLFVRQVGAEERRLSWLKIRSIGQLKNTLAELIVVILFVQFLERVLLADLKQQLDWRMLVLPAAIVLLAGALKLLGLRHED